VRNAINAFVNIASKEIKIIALINVQVQISRKIDL